MTKNNTKTTLILTMTFSVFAIVTGLYLPVTSAFADSSFIYTDKTHYYDEDDAVTSSSIFSQNVIDEFDTYSIQFFRNGASSFIIIASLNEGINIISYSIDSSLQRLPGVYTLDLYTGNTIPPLPENYLNSTSFEIILGSEPTYCGQTESYYNIINGTDSSDYLFGTNDPDLIFGNGGNDIILSKGTNNCIYAGDGNDFVHAVMNINNTIYGGAGDDSIHIGVESSAYGQDGDDMILLSGNFTSSYTVDGGDGTSDVCISDRRNTSITTENCEITQ